MKLDHDKIIPHPLSFSLHYHSNGRYPFYPMESRYYCLRQGCGGLWVVALLHLYPYT